MDWTLITGGSKRLGAALSLHLAQMGLNVLIHYRTSEDEAQGIARACRNFGVNAEIICGDFSTRVGMELFIQDCLARFPNIKNLINNVGNYLVKSGAETSSDEWNALFQTNLHAPFALIRALIPSLCRLQGSIINMGVVGVGCVTADTYCTAYRTAKMALWMLTKSLGKELASQSVRVNMVSPGYIENAVDLPKDWKALPMRRPAALDEVIRVISFLLEEKNAYITGQNIEIGGGVRL